MRLLDALRKRDANLSALRRATRAAIVMPAMFAISDKVVGNPNMAAFAAFGCMGMLLFVDFGGRMTARVGAHVALVAGGVVTVGLGTLCGQSIWLATLGAFVVGFAVLFMGVVSSALASSAVPLLVAFVLPVTLGGPLSGLPGRLEGWLLAGGASLIAIVVMWPAPLREPLRASAASCCNLLAARLRAEVAYIRSGRSNGEQRDRAVTEASAAVASLRTSFYASPYRPTGLTTSLRTFIRLIDELVWLDLILASSPPGRHPTTVDGSICDLKLASADTLARCGTLLDRATGDPRQLEAQLAQLADARAAMTRSVITDLPVRRVAPAGSGGGSDDVVELVDALEPSFRTQEVSFGVSEIATNTEVAMLARQRPWWQVLLGQRPDGTTSSLYSFRERTGAHLRLDSVWLHNSLRGAIALAVAVLVAEETGVQHGFWVALGTLAVLRSNALTTGQNSLRALAGTTAGFIIGGALLAVVGTDPSVYWALLAPAVLLAGFAPSVISFAAGQAAFTVMILVLYNLIAPTGWQVGLVRVEDVAIGVAVSLVVGVVFWPRGAGPAFARAAADAYAQASEYVRGAIGFGLTRCDAQVAAAPSPADERRRAAAAARRLDDAFRGFLAEKGTKHVPLAEVTALVTGVAALRLAGDAIVDLWTKHDLPAAGDRDPARRELFETSDQVNAWYGQMATAISTGGVVPEALTHDSAADNRLIEAVRRDLQGEDGHGSAVAVKIIWTADHLDAARRLQAVIVPPARAVTAAEAHPWWKGMFGVRRPAPAAAT